MKKIVIVILIALLALGGYYFWNNRYKVFFKGDLPEAEQQSANNSEQAQNSTDEENTSDSTEDRETDPTGSNSKIGEYDCNQKCENRKNTATYEYCREICGFNEVPVPSKDDEGEDKDKTDCESMTGYEKDVCFKRKAINEKNDGLCKKISDKQIQESCFNRVTEELIP